jgi:hypothetical protein
MMLPTTRRLLIVCVITVLASLLGLVLALVFEWPTQFDGSGSPTVTLEEVVTKGTATSIPVGPWVALVVFAVLARSRRWWGTAAVFVLCLLGPLFVIGGLGEAFAPSNPYVQRSVLVTSGVVASMLGLSLLAAGIADLLERRRTPATTSS